MAGLIDRGLVGIDTACLIYLLESKADERGIWMGRLVSDETTRLVTATSCLAECLVVPFRESELVARRIEAAIEAISSLELIPLSADVAQEAARVRARTNFKLPDAIAIATAIVAGAEAFVTNDRRLARGDAGIEILIVDDLAGV